MLLRAGGRRDEKRQVHITSACYPSQDFLTLCLKLLMGSCLRKNTVMLSGGNTREASPTSFCSLCGPACLHGDHWLGIELFLVELLYPSKASLIPQRKVCVGFACVEQAPTTRSKAVRQNLSQSYQ